MAEHDPLCWPYGVHKGHDLAEEVTATALYMGITTQRRRFTVTGVVQGVGFRPFVYRVATELGLVGIVGNDSSAVFLEVQGPPAALDEFALRLVSDAPPLAEVASVHAEVIPAAADDAFRIVASVAGDGALTPIPPDIAVCAD
jgi:hydrogenase maturation protein HypF